MKCVPARASGARSDNDLVSRLRQDLSLVIEMKVKVEITEHHCESKSVYCSFLNTPVEKSTSSSLLVTFLEPQNGPSHRMTTRIYKSVVIPHTRVS